MCCAPAYTATRPVPTIALSLLQSVAYSIGRERLESGAMKRIQMQNVSSAAGRREKTTVQWLRGVCSDHVLGCPPE
jgi:hypothetical protein